MVKTNRIIEQHNDFCDESEFFKIFGFTRVVVVGVVTVVEAAFDLVADLVSV